MVEDLKLKKYFRTMDLNVARSRARLPFQLLCFSGERTSNLFTTENTLSTNHSTILIIFYIFLVVAWFCYEEAYTATMELFGPPRETALTASHPTQRYPWTIPLDFNTLPCATVGGVDWCHQFATGLEGNHS